MVQGHELVVRSAAGGTMYKAFSGGLLATEVVVASFFQNTAMPWQASHYLLQFDKVLTVLLLRSHMVLNFKQILVNIICGPWTFAPLVVLVESVSLARQQYAYVVSPRKHDTQVHPKTP